MQELDIKANNSRDQFQYKIIINMVRDRIQPYKVLIQSYISQCAINYNQVVISYLQILQQFQTLSLLVQNDMYTHGTLMVLSWYTHGTLMVHSWYTVCI